MSKPVYTFVVNAAQSEDVEQGVRSFRKEHGNLFDVRLFHVHEAITTREKTQVFEETLRNSAMVFLDIRGGGRIAEVAGAALADGSQPVLLLVGGSPELMRLVRLGSFSMEKAAERMEKASAGKPAQPFNIHTINGRMKMIERAGSLLPIGPLKHMKNWTRAMNYWKYGGAENVKNLIAFMATNYDGLRLPKPPLPITSPDFGLYNFTDDSIHSSPIQYKEATNYDKEKPTIGLLFYGGIHFQQSLIPAKAAAQYLTKECGCNVIGVFADVGFNLNAIQEYLMEEGRACVNGVMYFQWFQLTSFTENEAAESERLLQKLGVPIFDACPMFGREIDDWLESPEGMSPIEAMATVILPELDGMIEPIPSAGLRNEFSDVTNGMIKKVTAIENRIQRAAQRAANWAMLQMLANQNKRVALVIYDYPKGEESLANAAYLDTFESLRQILLQLQKSGYQVSDIPEKDQFPAEFISRGLVNEATWGGEDSAVAAGASMDSTLYRNWSESLHDFHEVMESWGSAPGDYMTHAGQFLIPHRQYGNILVGIQPGRGTHSDPDKLTHDKTLPPNHQYVAYYRWLEEEWKPDAIVHVGTHGTLEFLKGKEIGMSQQCWPEQLIGKTPHLYLYHVVNASEATIAKRRSLGVLINYNSPSFTTSELYEDWSLLDDDIQEMMEARVMDPGRAERLEQHILEKAAELGIQCDSVEDVQEELTLMRRSIIPKGLHIFGEKISDEDAISFGVFLTRQQRGEIRPLPELLAKKRGIEGAELQASVDSIDQECRQLVEAAFLENRYPEDHDIATAVRYAVEKARMVQSDLEMESLLSGLNGRFIRPGIGGDPIRNPETLPTGRNSFQFDPRLVPSPEACRRGQEIAENTLSQYQEIHREYPNSVAVILWGFETTKTRGETVGQVLAYLGVRIVEGSNPWHRKLELIPVEELGRPRIDCHVQICGFFRDMYPNVREMIDRAFALVADADESADQNFIRVNTDKARESLAETLEGEALERVARGRIFGPRPGEYGTRTTGLIESSNWESEEEIVEMFTASMNHLYTDQAHGERHDQVYKQRLNNVQVVSQVRDCHEYEVADLDHYYEFFGGLSRSVESVTGKSPEMMISDTSKEKIRTEGVGQALNRGVRTRLLNPKFIDELLNHDFHGAQKLTERVENLIGFAATTHAVDQQIWSDVTSRYFEDEEMFRRMMENNRFATEAMNKRLLEAHQRGYWDASDEELELLRKRYFELEGEIEEQITT